MNMSDVRYRERENDEVNPVCQDELSVAYVYLTASYIVGIDKMTMSPTGLVDQSGDSPREYRKRVPMLVCGICPGRRQLKIYP